MQKELEFVTILNSITTFLRDQTMLGFLRRYQKYIFIAITVVIVISFSFFGTYSAFARQETPDTVAFTAVDGSRVYRSELNDLVRFLSNHAKDQFFWGGAAQGNAFNDGVITNNFLATGIAEVIVAPYLSDFRNELNTRLEKEKRYTPYVHPNASFLNAEQMWTYFAPDLKKEYDTLRMQTDPASAEAFGARVRLFLAEQRFPGLYMRQLLKYQEKEHAWLQHDPDLASRDFALFGYHSLQDWFGNGFVELIAKFILNTAKIAEEKGYEISKDEALHSLWTNLEKSFKESGRLQGVRTLEDYFQDQVRKLGMDQGRLVTVWRQVMLFRRYFYENADSLLVSDIAFKDFYQHQNEYVDCELYQLAPELRFQTLADVEKFELYLTAVRDPKEKMKGQQALLLPQKILSAEQVRKVFPELVQKQYNVRLASFNKDTLQTKVGVKKTWEWEVEAKNWKKLQEKFPELAQKKAATAEERIAILDQLDENTRNTIDSYSRSLIVNEHPEWLSQALEALPLKEQRLQLRDQGGPSSLDGIKNRQEFMRALDAAPLNEQAAELMAYTQDGIHYWRIIVLEKPEGYELLTFDDASSDGTIEQLYHKALEGSYARARSQKPSSFLKENGEWKPLAEVKDAVANFYFEDLIHLLDNEIEREKKGMPYFCNWENKEQARVAVRFLATMKKARQAIEESPEQAAQWIYEPTGSNQTHQNMLAQQFKLVRAKERAVRKQEGPLVAIDEAFSLTPDHWSKLRYIEKAGVSFFKVLQKGILPFEDELRGKVLEAKELLGKNLMQRLAKVLLGQMSESIQGKTVEPRK